MAAVPKFYELNGPSGAPVTTELTEIVFCSDDNVAPGNEHPLVKPGAGLTNRSFAKTLGFGFSTGPAVSCSDVQLYSDGAIGWTGCTLYIGDQLPSTYVQATGSVGNSGNDMTAVYSGVITSKTSFATYTSASPKTITMIKTSGTGIYTRFFIMQVDIADSAVVGVLGSEAISVKWLEV
jgi:hypothetical protein